MEQSFFAFEWRRLMTMLKILSAGLIATAMFTTAASARENFMNARHAEEHARPAGVFPFAPGAAGHPWMLAPPADSYNQAPSEQPDGICDHGDNPQIC
jgi:hypothetical protein